MLNHVYHSKGITLIELMVIIAIIAILATIAVPSFQDLIKRNQIAAQNNELIALIHLARNEAIRRNPVGNDTVLLQLDANTTAATWEGAVYPPDESETAAGCDPGAIRCATHTNGELTTSDTFELYFDNRGYSVDSAGNLQEVTLTLRHKACTTNRHAREVTIRRTGQVSSEPTDCE